VEAITYVCAMRTRRRVQCECAGSVVQVLRVQVLVRQVRVLAQRLQCALLAFVMRYVKCARVDMLCQTCQERWRWREQDRKSVAEAAAVQRRQATRE